MKTNVGGLMLLKDGAEIGKTREVVMFGASNFGPQLRVKSLDRIKLESPNFLKVSL